MIIPIIFNRRFSASGTTCSLLDVPVGTGTFYDHIARSLEKLEHHDVLIVGGSNRSTGASAVSFEELHSRVRGFESSDHLLFLDPGRWPIEDLDLQGLLQRSLHYHGAAHFVAVGDGQRTRERVDCDDAGRVCRIQRLYDSVNWPEAAARDIFLSWVPVHAMNGFTFATLAELRAALAAGGVLAHDMPMHLDLLDMASEHGFLRLNELVLDQPYAVNGSSIYWQSNAQGICVHQGARVHPGARLIGPLVIQEGAVVEQGVTLIGPAVVGAGARIQRQAVVASSVLAARSNVEAGSNIRHRVLSGKWSPSTCRSGSDLENRPPAKRAALRERIPSASFGGRLQLHVKRALDIFVSFSSLVVLSPLMLLTALLIKMESRGPVFFTHRRESRGGKVFACCKFRTMCNDAHRRQRELYKDNQLDGPQFKMDNDPRVTRLGRLLRATNIDELPQLFNVLLGHMSLVGPRPSPFRENQVCVPWRRARLSVRPGITGLWQICRSEQRSAQGDFHEWIYYDTAYVRHFSIWLDVKIVLATLLTAGGQWRIPLSWMIGRTRTHGPNGGKIVRGQLMVPI